jgi:hypothetical protein
MYIHINMSIYVFVYSYINVYLCEDIRIYMHIYRHIFHRYICIHTYIYWTRDNLDNNSGDEFEV